MDENIIGNKIRETRKRMKLSLEELQVRTNISISYLGQIERGEKINIGRDTILALCTELNLSPLVFFPEFQEKPSKDLETLLKKTSVNDIGVRQIEILVDAIIEIKGVKDK